MENNGCLGCTNRKVGCHSTCDKYLSWKKGVDDNNTKKRKAIKKYYNSFYHN